MEAYGGIGCIATSFLTLSLEEVEWAASCPFCFTPGERALGIHLIGGWVGSRASPVTVE
jgi:hypothetical protein